MWQKYEIVVIYQLISCLMLVMGILVSGAAARMDFARFLSSHCYILVKYTNDIMELFLAKR